MHDRGDDLGVGLGIVGDSPDQFQQRAPEYHVLTSGVEVEATLRPTAVRVRIGGAAAGRRQVSQPLEARGRLHVRGEAPAPVPDRSARHAAAYQGRALWGRRAGQTFPGPAGGAGRGRWVQLTAYSDLTGLVISSLLINDCSVVRFIPRRAAAPRGPAVNQFASSTTPRMGSRSS